MLWEIEYSDKKFVIDACIKRKTKLPDWYLNKPEINSVDYFYVNAFWCLNSCRYDRLGPIPWTVVIEYANFTKLDMVNTTVFSAIMMAIDAAYLDRAYKLAQKKK